MTSKKGSTDPDIRASLPAMKRAALRAQKLAKATGTPVYVLRKGRVVNLNPSSGKSRRTTA